MIIYGVWYTDDDSIVQLFHKAEDANDFVDSRMLPLHYYVTEMQVY